MNTGKRSQRTRRDTTGNSRVDRWTARMASFCRADMNGTNMALLCVRAFGDSHSRELLLQRPLVIQQSFNGLWVRVYSSRDGDQLRLCLSGDSRRRLRLHVYDRLRHHLDSFDSCDLRLGDLYLLLGRL